MANLRRGDFNKRVTISVPNKTQDDLGGHGEEYTPLLTTWAHVTMKRGRRTFDGGADTMIEEGEIYIYYRNALNGLPKDAVLIYNGKIYTIDVNSLVEQVKHIIKFNVTGSE